MVKRFINVFALSTLFLICSVRLRLTITTEGRGEQIKQIKQIHLLPRATLVVYVRTVNINGLVVTGGHSGEATLTAID